MFCTICGNEIREGAQFCVYCGARVERTEDFSNDPEPQQPIQEPEFAEADIAEEESSGGSKKRRLLIILASLLVAALASGAGMFFSVNSNEEDQAATSNVNDIRIIDTDWNWDDASSEDGRYEADVIMSVSNEAEAPIIGIEFNANVISGDVIENAKEPGKPFRADGYIPAHSSGIMVARVQVDEQNDTANTCTATRVVINSTMPDDYKVPEGYITDNNGPDANYYDIKVRNPNDAKVSKNSIVVAVQLDGSRAFKGNDPTDATGRIDSDIEAGRELEQKKAFVDPQINNKEYSKYTVYVLDTDYYNNAK